MENLNTALSEKIKLLRFKTKKSQEEIANELNVSRNTYARWENYPITLDLKTLEKIGIVLNYDMTNFFNEYVADCNENNEVK